jgi:hypothetical protein
MITIIHGNHIAQSRNYFFSQKQKNPSAPYLHGETYTLSDLAQAFSGGSLFDEVTYIFIEEFFSKRKQGTETDALIQYIREHHAKHTVFLWESKELTAKQLASFPLAENKKFAIPKYLFLFLDSLIPHNSKKAIYLFHQTLQTEESEFVFFMLVRQFRILLALDEQADTTIDEVLRLSFWQKTKLEKQAKAFGKEKLLFFFKELFHIEEAIKTGKLLGTLAMRIDFLLLSL